MGWGDISGQQDNPKLWNLIRSAISSKPRLQKQPPPRRPAPFRPRPFLLLTLPSLHIPPPGLCQTIFQPPGEEARTTDSKSRPFKCRTSAVGGNPHRRAAAAAGGGRECQWVQGGPRPPPGGTPAANLRPARSRPGALPAAPAGTRQMGTAVRKLPSVPPCPAQVKGH